MCVSGHLNVRCYAWILIVYIVPSKSQLETQATASKRPLEKHLSYEDSRRFVLDHHETLLQGGSYELANIGDTQYGAKSGDSTQRVRVVVDYDASKDNAPKKMWNSFWLHSVALLALLAIFMSMFIATIVLYHFSEARHGLNTTISTNRYSWTYSPTACRSLGFFFAIVDADSL